MACYFPVPAWRRRGALAPDGTWPLTFKEKEGWKETQIMVPCGKCLGCRLDYARSWALRCMHEASLHSKSCCITLTYDDSNLPPNGCLRKSDLQKFFKRARKILGNFRYFGAGEYGAVGCRPHYHILLFGVDFADKRLVSRHCGENFYDSETLRKLWPFGHVSIGSVSYKSAAYVARYCLKKQERNDNHDVEEFTVMSLKPGIGADWLIKYKSDLFSSGAVISHDGIYKIPSFYERKIKDSNPEEYLALKIKRMSHVVTESQLRLYQKSLAREANLQKFQRSFET